MYITVLCMLLLNVQLCISEDFLIGWFLSINLCLGLFFLICVYMCVFRVRTELGEKSFWISCLWKNLQKKFKVHFKEVREWLHLISVNFVIAVFIMTCYFIRFLIHFCVVLWFCFFVLCLCCFIGFVNSWFMFVFTCLCGKLCLLLYLSHIVFVITYTWLCWSLL